MSKKGPKIKTELTIEKAQKIIFAKNEIISNLESRLDSAYKEQEQMLVELNRNLEMMKYHCDQVRHNTGEVTLEDVCYSANLINRIMKHKFEFKPKSFE